jgi:enoyl-CoA hydratase/carnithine racemase
VTTMSAGPPVLNTLTLEFHQGGVALLRINRPERMNSMTVEMFEELHRAAAVLRTSAVRALVVTGQGDRAFCAGFDLDMFDPVIDQGMNDFRRFCEMATQSLAAIRDLRFPVIAAVHGGASGGGMSLALAADVRIASPSAKFNAAFVKVGLSIGELGTSWNLLRIVGPGRAAEIAYTGRVVGAAEAERIGLVNKVVPAESLLDEALAMARAIGRREPWQTQQAKRSLKRSSEITSFDGALELEHRSQSLALRTEDLPASSPHHP